MKNEMGPLPKTFLRIVFGKGLPEVINRLDGRSPHSGRWISGTTTSRCKAMEQAFSAQPSVLNYRGNDEAGDDDEIPLSDSLSPRVANRD